MTDQRGEQWPTVALVWSRSLLAVSLMLAKYLVPRELKAQSVKLAFTKQVLALSYTSCLVSCKTK